MTFARLRFFCIFARIAGEFLRKTQSNPPFRFDVVSVYFEPGRPPEVELFRDAFAIA